MLLSLVLDPLADQSNPLHKKSQHNAEIWTMCEVLSPQRDCVYGGVFDELVETDQVVCV